MVLPIYVSLERLDESFLEASRDLGAGPIATLRQIVLPLAAPGILSGIVLVFIPVMGEYLIPILLGGGKTYFLGNALADLFLQSRNWPFGSALAAVFVAGMIVLVALLPGAVASTGQGRAGAEPDMTAPRGEASERWGRATRRGWLHAPRLRVPVPADRHRRGLFSSTPAATCTELLGFSTQVVRRGVVRSVPDRTLSRNSLTIATHHGGPRDDPGDGVGAGDGPAREPQLRWLFELLTYVAIIVPGIVIGIATLIFIVTAFDWLNPWIAYLRRAAGRRSSGSASAASSRRTRCSRWPSSTCWSEHACGAWTERSSRRPRTCSQRRGGRSSR